MIEANDEKINQLLSVFKRFRCYFVEQNLTSVFCRIAFLSRAPIPLVIIE